MMVCGRQQPSAAAPAHDAGQRVKGRVGARDWEQHEWEGSELLAAEPEKWDCGSWRDYQLFIRTSLLALSNSLLARSDLIYEQRVVPWTGPPPALRD